MNLTHLQIVWRRCLWELLLQKFNAWTTAWLSFASTQMVMAQYCLRRIKSPGFAKTLWAIPKIPISRKRVYSILSYNRRVRAIDTIYRWSINDCSGLLERFAVKAASPCQLKTSSYSVIDCPRSAVRVWGAGWLLVFAQVAVWLDAKLEYAKLRNSGDEIEIKSKYLLPLHRFANRCLTKKML